MREGDIWKEIKDAEGKFERDEIDEDSQKYQKKIEIQQVKSI